MLDDYDSVKRIYMELHEAVSDRFEAAGYLKNKGKEIYFALPSVFREKDREKLLSYLRMAASMAASSRVISSITPVTV